jgi:CHAD domain-containing protein
VVAGPFTANSLPGACSWPHLQSPAVAAVSAPAPELHPPEGYALLPGRSSGVTRHWYDTFDRRLLSAGLELYVELEGSRAQVVAGRLGRPDASAPWDGPVRSLPEVVRAADLGPAVGAVVLDRAGPRALVRLVTARLRLEDHRVVDAEQKTVCRVVVETATTPGAGGSVRNLATSPLRGYESETAEVAAALGAGPVHLLPALLDADGTLEAPGAGPPGRDLRPELPAPTALVSILRRLLETVHANVPGTLARWDQEFLHDLRVAVRRGRTVLKLARDVLPEEPRAALAAELKWLGDVTTPARDLDVNIAGFPALEAVAVADELRDDIAPFTAFLAERGETAHYNLQAALGSRRFRRLTAGSLASLLPAEPGGTQPVTAELARRRLDESFGRVVRRGKRIGGSSPDEAVHDLRKRAKELRYTIEFFSGLLPGDQAAPLIKDLKGLQDVLGDFNDTVVQRALLLEAAEALAAEGVSPRTIVVLGEMRRELARSGEKARGQLGERSARLRRWRTDGRWGRLVGSLR